MNTHQIDYLLTLINADKRSIEKELKDGCEVARAKVLLKRYEIMEKTKDQLYKICDEN